jgi:hypothetical protein
VKNKVEMAEERKQIDWEKVEKLYRPGKLSLRDIANICNCCESGIRRKAKAEGWARDLSARVDEAVRNKLVRIAVRTASAPSEKEIIEAAAEISASIVLGHRKELVRLKDNEDALLAELEGKDGQGPTKLFITQYQGQIVEKVVGMTVAEQASTLLALANVRIKRMEMERKTWGIADGNAPAPGSTEADPYEGLPDHVLDIIRGKSEE